MNAAQRLSEDRPDLITKLVNTANMHDSILEPGKVHWNQLRLYVVVLQLLFYGI